MSDSLTPDPLGVACPICREPAGSECRKTIQGGRRGLPHLTRVASARTEAVRSKRDAAPTEVGAVAGCHPARGVTAQLVARLAKSHPQTAEAGGSGRFHPGSVDCTAVDP